MDDGPGWDRGAERGAVAGHIDIQVRPDARARIDESIPDARDLSLEVVDDRRNGRAMDIDAALGSGKQGNERSRQMDMDRRSRHRLSQ